MHCYHVGSESKILIFVGLAGKNACEVATEILAEYTI